MLSVTFESMLGSYTDYTVFLDWRISKETVETIMSGTRTPNVGVRLELPSASKTRASTVLSYELAYIKRSRDLRSRRRLKRSFVVDQVAIYGCQVPR